MTLDVGQKVRFKGFHAAERAQAFADELHGRCKPGDNAHEFEITKPSRFVLDALPRNQEPRLSRDEIIEFGGRNGQSAAEPMRRA